MKQPSFLDLVLAGLSRRAIDTLIFYGALIAYQRGHLWWSAIALSIAVVPWPKQDAS